MYIFVKDRRKAEGGKEAEGPIELRIVKRKSTFDTSGGLATIR